MTRAEVTETLLSLHDEIAELHVRVDKIREQGNRLSMRLYIGFPFFVREGGKDSAAWGKLLGEQVTLRDVPDAGNVTVEFDGEIFSLPSGVLFPAVDWPSEGIPF